MDLDVVATEKAEKSIDEFIDKRARDKAAANKEEEAWKASTRLVNEKRREANRRRWIEYHGDMHQLHLGIATEHADKRSRLMAEGEYEPEEKEGEIKNV
jgi:hypothetical protein